MCHTYYHVYVTFLKELKLLREAGGSAEDIGKADLVLSSLSNHFEDLKGRVERIGLFREVMEFDEKREDFFPELARWREGGRGFLGNLYCRMAQRAAGGALCAGEFCGLQGCLCVL